MSNDKEDENLLHMTKEDLQRWIQAEVDRNPQLMQRREQLAQVEEWVKQKEREATYTRLLYSNACESVLECESVMKGLYGMLGLEYRDVDSEEEGGSVKEPQDVIHITDDEETAKDNRGLDGGNLDVVAVDLGATKESLKPMLEKVTVAIQKSSRLIQDLVQMVNKETVSTVSSEASSDITTRPSSTSTPEASSSESVIPTQSPSPINQPISMTIPTESLDISDRSTAAIKTEPLLMAVTPSETALLPKSSEQFENIASHNFPSIAEFKTELQLTSITPSEMSLLLSNSEQCNTTASHDSPSMGAMKIEPQLAGITPEMSSLPGSSQQFETVASPSLASIVAIKTEPQLSIVTPFETSSLPDSTHQFETIVSRNSDSIVKTEPPMRPVSPEMSSLSSDSTPPEIIASYNSKFISSIKTEPQLTVLTPPEMSSLQSDSKQSKRIVGEDSASIATNMFESQRTAKSSSKTSSSPSSSEQCETITSNNSASTEKTTENAATRKKSTRSKANRKSSKTASSIVNTPSSQKETAQTSSLSDSISETSDTEMPEPPDSIPQSSTNATPDSTTTKVMTGPSSSIKQPAASTEPSDTRGSQASSNMSSKPGQVPTKEIVLKVNSEVLGKWNNKTWCQGRVENIKKTENGHKYNVQFKENKGQRLLPAHHVACVKPPLLKDLFIGCRLVACSKDDKGNTWYNAAVLAELPDRKNRMRFMVFFDDGRVSYVALPDLHLVCKQLKKVWKDIEEQSSRLRVKEYVRVYPTPIAVVLRIGQDTKAERNGKFEPCSVLQLDGSLIQICYKRDQFKEWVYKGSDKLEHIVNIKKRLAERKTQQPTKTAGTNLPQHNTTSASVSVTPATVTSTAVTAETTPPIKVTPQADTTISKTHSITPRNAKSAKFQPKVVLQRLTGPCSIYTAVANDKIQTNLSVKRTAPTEEGEEPVSEKTHSQLTYMPHRCCSACLDRLRPSQVDEHRGQNPLLIPLLFKFRRMTARRRLEGKVYFHIFYRTPCGRSLCDMEEVQEYLFETRCDFLFLEMFCIDPFVLVNRARPPSISTSQPRLFLPDVSEGKEDVQVPCVNEVDETPAPIVKYTKDRVPAAGVSINTSLDFLIGCDCTDGCRDRSKCSCHQLTIGATSLCSGGPVDVTAGYTHKRLLSSLPTGLYECNPLCRCDPRTCSNRLVQHGLQLRLELFMTQHKGWGIRCKDDVAKGTFVCVFTGKIVTEDKMNEDDTVSGNEYLANLDFIEGVEKLKEGYESEAYCSDTEGEMNKKTITMKTGPLWKNTLFSEDSSSGEEKEEPMEIEQEEVVKKESKTVCESLSEKKMSPKLQESSENALRNVTSLANKMRENGLETSGTNPKRCFAIKSTQRRVKPQGETEAQNEKTRKVQPVNNTRRLFNGEEACYIIDARQEGNLGRYINHSCSPNLFVQNVFVDTHDLRFPWVAFFASKRIKAGTELTWDYNYEVGSVEGKVLLCCCGSSRCTGRLL